MRKSDVDDHRVARSMALATAWLRALVFRQKYEHGISRFKMTARDRAFLNQIFSASYAGGKLYWSNRSVKTAAAEAMIDAYLEDYEADPGRERWLGTFAWNDGLTSERAPSIDLISLKGKVGKAMREYGLEGIGVVEVDVTTHIPGEDGKLLLVHVHIYCWKADGSSFSPVTTANSLMASRRFPNRLGAPSVDFKAVSSYPISVARVAGYLMKFQPGAKNRIPRRDKPGRYALRSTIRGFTPDSVVRLVEVMSHLDARDMVFSVGPNGRVLRDAWYARLMEWARSRPTRKRPLINYGVAEHWRSIRADNGSKKMKACRIVTRVSQRHKFD